MLQAAIISTRMIQINELRLGNLLLSDGNTCVVTSISKNNVGLELLLPDEGAQITHENLEYLPLSEEWMNTFAGNETGAITMSELERTTDSSDIIILSTIECYLHDEGFLRVCAYEYDKEPDGSLNISDDVITLGYKHIRYVHQLQNLYFDLCGKELRY